MPVILPVVTPVVALKDEPLSVQGKPLLETVNTRPKGPVQLLKLSAVTEPRLVPAIPWPLLRVLAVFEDLHDSTEPVAVSFSVVVPAFAVILPPGVIENV